MAVRTYGGTESTATGAGARLSWWALALPAAAFVALLLLVTGPGGAPAAAGDPAAGGLLEQIRHTLPL